MILVRILLFTFRKKYRVKLSRKPASINSVLIGENNYSRTILSNPEIRVSMGVRGYYSHNKSTFGRYLGNFDDLIEDITHNTVDNIIICDDSIKEDLYNKILKAAEDNMVRVYIVPDFKYFALGPHSFDLIQGIPFIKMMPEPLSNTENQFIKRIFDFAFSLFVVVFVLSWLIPLIAIIIKLESKGPVFFKQKRSGIKNETFECIKFRSMTVNSHSDVMTAKKNDARVTRFGAFMRKTSIDELPQFLNVLIGNMSVVGPRPHMLSQTKQYSQITRKYMLRHMIKPGITGWAQVMGSRGEIFSDTDMEKRIEKDIWYIQNWSFFLDLKIIFLTFYNIVKGDDQAY